MSSFLSMYLFVCLFFNNLQLLCQNCLNINAKQEISAYARRYWKNARFSPDVFISYFTYLTILLVLHVICQLPQHLSLTEFQPQRPYTLRLEKIIARRLQFSPGGTLNTVKKGINSGTRSCRVSAERGVGGAEMPHEQTIHTDSSDCQSNHVPSKKRLKKKKKRSATNYKQSVKLLKLRKWTPSDGRKPVLYSTRLSSWKLRHYICIDTAGGRRLHRV